MQMHSMKSCRNPGSRDQLEAIIVSVENARKKDPKGYKKKPAAKLLAAVLKVAAVDIVAATPEQKVRTIGQYACLQMYNLENPDRSWIS
jgi:hypothetical protein